MRKHYLSIDGNKIMNASYRIYKPDNLIFEVFDGHVTLSNLISYDSYLKEDPNYSEEKNILADLRATEIIISFNDVTKFVDYFNSISGGKGRKLACVFSPTYCQLFSTMFAANQSKLNIDIKFCKSLKSALSWLGKTELSSSFNQIQDEARREHMLVS